ncbi:MAG TPA: MmcB family DNA repair protein [Thermohalobaculum sp.]|nr:MmcB family DNA repair protein [Thermohalobaculum sp.]
MTAGHVREREAAPGVLIARGVCRALGARGFACLTEFTTRERLRMDVVALGPRGEIWCVEVKSSRADFRTDRKWQGYLDWCDALFFAVPESFPTEILPPEHGLILADGYDGEILRQARPATLAPSRRKAMVLQIARLAAERLAAAGQPQVTRPIGM